MKAIIKGGKKPKGKVKVSGAKNSATRLLAAATISDGDVILDNFPINLVDARHKMRFLKNMHLKRHMSIRCYGIIVISIEVYLFTSMVINSSLKMD